MVITHKAVKAKGDTGTHQEWNDEHDFDDENRALRGSSFVVAASDSRDKERADYVCDGTADEVEINTAITALPAGGGGIQLLEGTYDINSPIIISKDNVSISGMGRATLIQTSNSVKMIVATAKTGLLIEKVWLDGVGVWDVDNDGIEFVTVTYSTIKHCWLTKIGGAAINLQTNCNSNLILGNKLTNCYSNAMTVATGSSYNVISNNRIYTSVLRGVTGWQGHYNVYSSNIITDTYEGMNLSSGVGVIVANNIIMANSQHGIYLYGMTQTTIEGNLIKDNDVGNTAMFDGIFVLSCDECIIAGNRCKDNDRYEINISDAASDDNLLHGNHCKGVDHVGAINDAGTGTTSVDNVIA